MMSQNISFKEAERKAFRSTFQDGLWDIYLGLLLLNMGLGLMLGGTDVSRVWTAVILLAFTLLVMLAFWAGKKFVTAPRIGLVRFGPARRAKVKKIGVILSLSVLVGVILLVIGQVVGNDLAEGVSWGWIIPAGVFGVNAIVVFSLGAYFLDFYRAYVYGWLYALSFPASIMLAEYADITFPFAYFVSAGIMVLIGGVLFLRFLRDYPIPAEVA
jgi:hypothetical protein